MVVPKQTTKGRGCNQTRQEMHKKAYKHMLEKEKKACEAKQGCKNLDLSIQAWIKRWKHVSKQKARSKQRSKGKF